MEDIEYSKAIEDEKRVDTISELMVGGHSLPHLAQRCLGPELLFPLLQGILREPLALDTFMQFVVENHAEEHLLFWVDAEDYK